MPATDDLAVDSLLSDHSQFLIGSRVVVGPYNTGLRLENHSGNGTTVVSGNDTTNYFPKVTACVNLAVQPDWRGRDDRPGGGR
ncbi:hypothetical protein OHT52_03115 [Streptomyces sp. NBC_00247]|uniref:hypothetical protein n=1 Tax=Streptomyces sp. NBC_00247 TaxID=2975689 RepID=UPI002E2E7DE1|nr:hypothetical protein [Streptomyces sp. NBC_00247]